mmetsp:Transcript_141543/g.394447  ORF Transcript_141543/g.394447 Transcript_141543/m.394447 type:complete len:234 (-) Transcript_141543:740-1441(-)
MTCQSVVGGYPGHSAGCRNHKAGGSKARAAGKDMYHVVSSGLSPICLPRNLPRMRSIEPAQMETKQMKTPSIRCSDSTRSLDASSSESVTSPAQQTPNSMTATSVGRTLGTAPGWKMPIPTCIANVTSGRQDRITRFSEIATSERLKLLRPMFAAKARAKHRTAASCERDARRFGWRCQDVNHESGKMMLTARNATTCWTPVMRKAAGTPLRPSSCDMVASESNSFMKRLRPD